MTFLDFLDVQFGFSCEKIPHKGEDSWCHSFHENAGMLGVFDGCGGLGAAVYSRISGKTGAYLASRAASKAAMDWFSRGSETGVYRPEALQQSLMDCLGVCVRAANTVGSKFRGSMVRLMPSTCSVWLIEPEGELLRATSINAGDSRNYILCDRGLFQISVDDLHGEDAMSNLYNDGAMTNVISADGNFTLGVECLDLDAGRSPCILISATDGCFGYLRSPMEFEFLLLDTLMHAESVDSWQASLQEVIGAIAGDDQSFAAAAFGFGTFQAMQQTLAPRHRTLQTMLSPLGDSTEKRWEVWETYKHNYYRLTEGGAPNRV